MQNLKSQGMPLRHCLRIFVIALLLLSFFAETARAAEPNFVDREAQRYFNGNNRIGRLNWFGNEIMGNGFTNLMLGGAFWGYGELADKPKESYAGLAQMEAVVATGVTVTLIKELSNRRRPDDTDELAFPSAHSAYAFTTAAVLGSFYGPTVGIPAYALALLTAVGRMQDNRHWFTDTLGGAVIGIGFGLMFAKMNKKSLQVDEQERAVQTSSFRPLLGPDTLGASFTVSF